MRDGSEVELHIDEGFGFFDHTADVGYWIRSGSLEGLFSFGASAFYDLALSENLAEASGEEAVLSLQAENLVDLFHDWLQRLLFLLDTESVGVQRTRFSLLNETCLIARFQKTPVRREARKVEVKAVTYHQLAVNPVQNGWQARVIFDI